MALRRDGSRAGVRGGSSAGAHPLPRLRSRRPGGRSRVALGTPGHFAGALLRCGRWAAWVVLRLGLRVACMHCDACIGPPGAMRNQPLRQPCFGPRASSCRRALAQPHACARGPRVQSADAHARGGARPRAPPAPAQARA